MDNDLNNKVNQNKFNINLFKPALTDLLAAKIEEKKKKKKKSI